MTYFGPPARCSCVPLSAIAISSFYRDSYEDDDDRFESNQSDTYTSSEGDGGGKQIARNQRRVDHRGDVDFREKSRSLPRGVCTPASESVPGRTNDVNQYLLVAPPPQTASLSATVNEWAALPETPTFPTVPQRNHDR